MQDLFVHICRFLESSADEAEGREARPLTSDEEGMLTLLANGQLSREELGAAESLLATNSTALEWLAQRVRTA